MTDAGMRGRGQGHSRGQLWLIYAGLQDNDLPALRAQGGKDMRDAVMFAEPGRALHYAFRYASVYVEQIAYHSVVEAVGRIEVFEAEDRIVSGRPAQFKTLVLVPDGGPGKSETAARIMMAEPEGGEVGETERQAVYQNFLDFGEHSVAVSPAGLVIAGSIDEAAIYRYLYYVAQIGSAVCRYSANESRLSDVMDNIRAKAKHLDIEALQQINVTTSKAMLDISDELLSIPPRESFILRTLLSTSNVSVYEERIGRMLEIIQHHVEHRHHLKAERNSRRIEFVLFVIAVLGALAGLAEIFATGTDVAADFTLASGLVFISISITVIASYWFYRASTMRK